MANTAAGRHTVDFADQANTRFRRDINSFTVTYRIISCFIGRRCGARRGNESDAAAGVFSDIYWRRAAGHHRRRHTRFRQTIDSPAICFILAAVIIY